MKDALGRARTTQWPLTSCRSGLLAAQRRALHFLDGLGIEHDENGTLEQLPPAPTTDDLKKAIDALLTKHSPGIVAAYLQTFPALDDSGGWATLEELLKEDERLKF
jgi:hypothetical protein